MDIFNPMVDLPMGLGMALSQDLNAMKYFSSLSPDQQRDIIDQTHRITSKSEMKQFVNGLTQSAAPQDLAP